MYANVKILVHSTVFMPTMAPILSTYIDSLCYSALYESLKSQRNVFPLRRKTIHIIYCIERRNHRLKYYAQSLNPRFPDEDETCFRRVIKPYRTVLYAIKLQFRGKLYFLQVNNYIKSNYMTSESIEKH